MRGASALIAFIAALHGCADAPPDDRPAPDAPAAAPVDSAAPAIPDATPGAMPDSVTLTAAQPRTRLDIEPAAIAGSDVFVFTVADVRNPDGLSIGVEAGLRPADAAADDASVLIGRIALFPVDRGGTFTLRVPHAVAALVARAQAAGTPLQLELMLVGNTVAGENHRSLAVHGIRWTRTGG
ncbi:MAG TPA: hypothetical protein VMO26_02370 [Vicinamibacterales bacterium]|nr:hypothetical protein [Vicinamibacterales bacterium]